MEQKHEFGKTVGNRRKYPWERWFAMRRVELKRGIDYELSQASMCSSIKNAASLRKVSVKLTDNGDSIIIQRNDKQRSDEEDA